MAIRYHVFSTSYKCPQCGRQYDYTATSTSPFGTGNAGHDFKDFLASPFIKCGSCGHIFVDNRFSEWVSMTEEQKNNFYNQYNPYRLLGLILPFGSLGLMFLIIGITVPHYIPIIIGSCGLVVAIINLVRLILRFNFVKKRKYNKIINESVQRCLNKKYLIQLRAAGFAINKVSDLEELNNENGRQLNHLIDEIN